MTQKNRHLDTIAQFCRAVYSQLRHMSTIGKKYLNSNISSICLHNMVNFGPLAAEIGSLVWDTPANFNGFRVLASLLQQRRSSEANQTARCLAVSWAGNTFSGALARWQNFARCNIHFTSNSCVLLYWQRYCTALAAAVSQTAAWYTGWNYETFAEGATYIRRGGHHVEHRPTS